MRVIPRCIMAAALFVSVFFVFAVLPGAPLQATAFSPVSGSSIKINAASPSIVGDGAQRVWQNALPSAPTLILLSSTASCRSSFSGIRSIKFAPRATARAGGRTHHQHLGDTKTQLHASTSPAITTGGNSSNINFSILLASAISRRGRIVSEVKTLLRVLLPAIVSGIIASMSLPALSQHVTKFVLRRGGGGASMLSDVVSSFISLIGLLYSILMGQVFGFLYTQQEVSVMIEW